MACIAWLFVATPSRAELPTQFPVMDTGVSGIDLSELNHKPAGKFGFVRVKDGHFFTDEGRFRFVGVALVSSFCYPPKEYAEPIARYFAAHGVNMVRLHFFMNKWGWDDKNPSPDRDTLDYFIAALIRHGIYVDLDLYDLYFVPKQYSIEGVKYGGNDYLYFSKCIESAKAYATSLFSHVNPYLKRAYKDEPGIAITELVNENSFFWNDALIKVSGPQKAELEELFIKWVQSGGATPAECSAMLMEQAKGVTAGNIVFGSVHEIPVMKRFAVHLLERYYGIMMDHLKSIGVKIPVTGHNAPFGAADLLALKEKMDYTCNHFYWTHTDYSALAAPLNNFWLFPAQLARSKVDGMPVIFNELSYSHPNKFRSEGLAETVAYGSLQDMDGVVFFSSVDEWPSSKNEKGEKVIHTWRNPPTRLQYHAQLLKDPAIWPLMPTFAMTFRRDYIQPARNEFRFAESAQQAQALTPRDIHYTADQRKQFDKELWVYRQAMSSSAEAFRDLPPLVRYYEKTDLFQLLCMTSRIGWRFEPGADRLLAPGLPAEGLTPSRYAFDYMPGNADWLNKQSLLKKDLEKYGVTIPAVENGTTLVSDTGEIRRNFDKGILRVETPRACVASGTITGENTMVGGDLTLRVKNPHLTAMLVSLDGAPLKTSRKVMLAFGVNAHNVNQDVATKDFMIGSKYETGQAPILRDEVQGAVVWKRSGKASVFREELETRKLIPVTLTGNASALSFDLDAGTLRYVITFE